MSTEAAVYIKSASTRALSGEASNAASASDNVNLRTMDGDEVL